jgi:hypothetical protein
VSGLLGLLLATVVGFGGPAGYLNLPVHVPEPYGGCKEAADYPGTQGAADCGWTRMPRSQQRVGHEACWWLVGLTTYVSCPDGYRTTS